MAAQQGVRQPGTYHAYDAMVALLRVWAQAHPLICELESIGASPEGRELWLLTLTDAATGPPPPPVQWGGHRAGFGRGKNRSPRRERESEQCER